jgi:homoserine dehydrogenase
VKDFRVGLLGLGVVGSGTARILLENADLIQRRLGRRVVLARAVDADPSREAAAGLPPGIFSTRWEDLLEDRTLDAVVELVGGTGFAGTAVLAAIAAGKHVVTANKALLAERWEEIFAAARAGGVEVSFEASVGGGIPIIRSLREGLAANRIQAIYGIINGTSNYILSRMTETGADFDAALAEAQAQGYAEADPILDVGGGDAAHKLCILATLAFGGRIPYGAIHVEGITGLTPMDIEYARELGYVVKLLGVAKETEGRVETRVNPTLVPADAMLASVSGAYNAIFVRGDAVGSTLYYGRGAGSLPTGSAVVGDLMSLAVLGSGERACHLSARIPVEPLPPQRLLPVEEVRTSCYVRFAALDRPGVLSSIAGILGEKGISIASVIQKGRREGGPVPIVMMTHEARERDFREAMEKIGTLAVVAEKPVVIRVEREF